MTHILIVYFMLGVGSHQGYYDKMEIPVENSFVCGRIAATINQKGSKHYAICQMKEVE